MGLRRDWVRLHRFFEDEDENEDPPSPRLRRDWRWWIFVEGEGVVGLDLADYYVFTCVIAL